VLKFTNIAKRTKDTVVITWSGAPGKSYALYRYETSSNGTGECLAKKIQATLPDTTFIDANIPVQGSYYYILRLEDE
jgi:hypothetical protein